MPANTTTNTSLSLTLDGGDEMNCQIIDCSFVPPSNSVGDRVLTASATATASSSNANSCSGCWPLANTAT